MFSTDDTIVALATPPGRGAIAVVRLSGPDAATIAAGLAGRPTRLQARRATRVSLSGTSVGEDALVTFFPAPASYTGQDVIEVSVHGSPVVVAAVVERAVDLGARLAEPGEFTLRAFVFGKLDLTQAEAVQDIVAAVSPMQVRAAIAQLGGALSGVMVQIAAAIRELQMKLEASMDFPEEGYRFIEREELQGELASLRERVRQIVASGARGHVVRDGLRVVVAGSPNVGKSSIFNALVGVDRAIVSEMSGTTRDLVSVRLVVHGGCVELIDTAGVRPSADVVESEGIRRGIEAVRTADLVVVVLDRSRPLTEGDFDVLSDASGKVTIVVGNKCDLAAAWDDAGLDLPVLHASAVTGAGMAALADRIGDVVSACEPEGPEPLITNRRHLAQLEEVLEHLEHAWQSASSSGGEVAEEFIAADLQLALVSLEELTGTRTAEEVLREIFSRFCIGK